MEVKKLVALRSIVITAMILYVLCPDLFPGPFDDALVIALGVIASASLNNAKRMAMERERNAQFDYD